MLESALSSTNHLCRRGYSGLGPPEAACNHIRFQAWVPAPYPCCLCQGQPAPGFHGRAAWLLGHEARLAVYIGFFRPILEYAPLVTMYAAQSLLARYGRVQEKAMRITGPGKILHSLQLRSTVSGLAYVYKLHYIEGPP